MADILKGQSAHKAFAPLTTGQSIQIAKHVEDQVRQVSALLETLTSDFGQTKDAVQGLQNRVGSVDASVATLKDKQCSTDNCLTATRKALSRTDARLLGMEADCEQSGHHLQDLRDSHSKTKAQQEAMQLEAGEMRHLMMELQAGLERNFLEKHDDRGRLEQIIARLEADMAGLSAGMLTMQTAVRDADKASRTMQQQLQLTGMKLENLDERFGRAAQALELTEKRLEETTLSSKRLAEDHEATKSRLRQVDEMARRVQMQADRTDKGLKSTTNGLGIAHRELGEAQQHILAHRSKLELAHSEVARLTEDHQLAEKNLRSVQAQAEHASWAAQAVHQGLRETNSMVLPNLQLGTGAASLSGSSIYDLDFDSQSQRWPNSVAFSVVSTKSSRSTAAPWSSRTSSQGGTGTWTFSAPKKHEKSLREQLPSTVAAIAFGST